MKKEVARTTIYLHRSKDENWELICDELSEIYPDKTEQELYDKFAYLGYEIEVDLIFYDDLSYEVVPNQTISI